MVRIPEQRRRPEWWRRIRFSVRSVAGQVFILQLAVVLLLILGAVLALVAQSRNAADQEARDRSVAVAQTFAHSPGILEALDAPDPAAILQPLAEETRQEAGVDFLVVMDTNGIRYSHPLPERIGQRFVGTIEPSLQGRTITESVDGPLGREVQAVVPVFDENDEVVGLVSAGLIVENVTREEDQQLVILLAAGGAALLVALGGTALVTRRLRRQTHGLDPAEMTRMYEHHDTVLHAVREGVVIIGGDGRLVLANDEAGRLLGLPPDAEGRPVDGLGLDPAITAVLASGRVATDESHAAGDRTLSLSQRPADWPGGPPGSVATLRDTTELRAAAGKADLARRRLRLLYDSGLRIGTSLDVTRTARELAEFAVARFADVASVDIFDSVLRGDEPEGLEVRRTALAGVGKRHPYYPMGELISFAPTTPQAFGFGTGRAVLEPDLTTLGGWRQQDPERARAILAYGTHSMITVPLRARGVPLGVVTFWRARTPEPFEQDDLSVAEELVARAALSIDNARRYTREHTMAVTLQRSLLPRGLPAQSALEVAHRYLPARAGVGGDWFDVIPLPGSRVALVVGDVVGHGLHAAVTMGRLRTAVHNFSTLDPPPEELLAHLDELVARIDLDEAAEGMEGITGVTCLYAVYDPVSGRCDLARAGHPGPALVHPGGTAEFPELPVGPPLGVGGMPFETAELHLARGSRLVLYTDGLIENRHRDIDEGLELLRAALAHPGRTPEETCSAVLEAMLPEHPSDDVALLVARTRLLPPERVAEWEVPFDPAAVGRMRAAVSERLAAWGLDALDFSTELILSELITNAIRHGSPPVRVRLLYDRVLYCEVSDGSSTSPHLRYAATTDEDGRGLFLVAQIADRWGTRYLPAGKIIWAEQPLP